MLLRCLQAANPSRKWNGVWQRSKKELIKSDGKGLPEAPLSGERSIRGVWILLQGWEWGVKKSRGSRMDPCKRQCLRCERSVVHSGKSLSRAAAAPWRGNYRENQLRWNSESVVIKNWWLVRLRQASGHPRGSHTKRPGGEMERMETGTVWLTLKVPLTLSPHWIPGLTQLQGTQS